MRRDSWLLGTFIIILIGLIVGVPQAGWVIKGFFSEGFASTGGTAGNELRIENDALRAEIAKLQNVARQLPHTPASYSPAIVYAHYPFGFKNEILIDRGMGYGSSIGKPVVILSSSEDSSLPAFLIGKVQKVFSNSSLVVTIFDKGWQSAVRIGSEGTEALLVGGPDPKLTLIPKTASIKSGDVIYSSAKQFPYGLVVGEVRDVRMAEDQLFQEASLAVSYRMESLHTVFLINNHDAPLKP